MLGGSGTLGEGEESSLLGEVEDEAEESASEGAIGI